MTRSRRFTSTKACRTPSTPTTARATARRRLTMAGSECWRGSRRMELHKLKRAPQAPFLFALQESVGVLTGLLDERRPLLDLGFEVRLQGSGRLLFGPIGDGAQVGEAL